jgi:hypothetical protein
MSQQHNSTLTPIEQDLTTSAPCPGRSPQWIAAKLLAEFEPIAALSLLALAERVNGNPYKTFEASSLIFELQNERRLQRDKTERKAHLTLIHGKTDQAPRGDELT